MIAYVLSTLELAYTKAHEDASAGGEHAGFATEVLHLTSILISLLPECGEAYSLAALVRYSEARRPSRVDGEGCMIPLSEQDPRLWRRDVIDEADALLIAAEKLDSVSPRFFQALLQRIWCNRQSLDNPAPWLDILRLYDRLLKIRDDAIVRVNRVVALAEVESLDAALNELLQLENSSLTGFLSFHAVHADLLCRLGRIEEATIAYRKVLALDPSPSERVWIQRKLTRLADK